MIISSTVDNCHSLKDKKVLSAEATAIKELNESVIEKEEYRLLLSAAIYGTNSSGEGNLLRVIGRFKKTANSSSRLNSTDRLKISLFLLG